jgi:hypothetical protein
MDIMSELKEVGVLFRTGDFCTGLKQLWDLWAEIPEPKCDTPNAYLVIEYGVAFSLKSGDLDEAQKWAALAPAFAEKRQDRGEVEFLVGKVAFERGEIEMAREKFFVANIKSKGRIFEGQDKKYKELIQ